MPSVSNKEVYSTVEFPIWSNGKNLLYEEKFLIDKYLDKQLKTLEAGTAGGRILLEMQKLNFVSLYGFDYIPKFIEQAKQKDTTHSITFEVQDATKLNYEDSSFEQTIYLQQIISSIDDEIGRRKALEEAYRILKSRGTALFSFLSFEARIRSTVYLPYLIYLRLYRKLCGSERSIQYLPWLKLGGKLNFSALFDRGSYNYWYKLQEIYQTLREVGFEVIAVGSNYQINQNRMHSSLETLVDEPIKGMIYIVCTK